MAKKTKQDEDNSDGFLTILFFLFTLYLSTLGAIIKVLRDVFTEIGSTAQIGQYITLLQIYGAALIGIGTIAAMYIIVIAIIGTWELKLYYSAKTSREIAFRKKVRNWILQSPGDILSIIPAMFVLLILTPFYYFNWIFASLSALIYSPLIFIYWTKNRYNKFYLRCVKDVVSTNKNRDLKSVLFTIYLMLVSLLTFIVVASILVFTLANYDIHLDKEFYVQGEDAYVTLYTKGIFRPVTKNVSYSNEKITLDYIRDSSYGSAPVYLRIPSEYLKSEPYNSYLTIEYKIQFYVPLFRESLSQEIFIPVFQNNTYILNNTSISSNTDLINVTQIVQSNLSQSNSSRF